MWKAIKWGFGIAIGIAIAYALFVVFMGLGFLALLSL